MNKFIHPFGGVRNQQNSQGNQTESMAEQFVHASAILLDRVDKLEHRVNALLDKLEKQTPTPERVDKLEKLTPPPAIHYDD